MPIFPILGFKNGQKNPKIFFYFIFFQAKRFVLVYNKNISTKSQKDKHMFQKLVQNVDILRTLF